MALLTWLICSLAVLAVLAASVVAAKQPNMIVILTDDQDGEMGSLDYMPLLHRYLLQEGTLFDRHYCTVSICCPSRVNIWTGRAAHNTNVTDLSPPYGGYPVFVREALNENWLPVWLQELGYNTYYTGKLFNFHNIENYNSPPVNGFNGSDFLLDPYTYDYYGAHMSRNFEKPISYAGQYSPDVVAEKAYGFLEEATRDEKPFFIGIAPIAPHSDYSPTTDQTMNTPKYAERHAHLFKDYKIPRTANFNPETPSGVSWVKDLARLNDTVIEYNDEYQRSRLRSLQAVDEMIEQIIQKLEAKGLLDSTYIFYTTDNGYHISQHRLPPGKECPFETDIHIPLVVRGPGVPAGHIANLVSSHTDLTPTFLKIAGSDRADLDGSPIPLSQAGLSSPVSGEHVNVEFWGRARPEGRYDHVGHAPSGLGRPSFQNNTYKALRIIGEGYSLLYTVWCTGEKECYDSILDPGQVKNLFGAELQHLAQDYKLEGASFEKVVGRLEALLLVLKSCKAHSCRKPWETLHPGGHVATLRDALNARFDTFYMEQPKVSFSSCPMGHIVSEEGPQEPNVWMDGGVPHAHQQGLGEGEL